MKTVLAMVGCLSVIGAALDGVIAAALALLVAKASGIAATGIDDRLADYFPYSYGIEGIADLALIDGTAPWDFAIPALLFLPVRIVLGLIIGAAAFYAAGSGR